MKELHVLLEDMQHEGGTFDCGEQTGRGSRSDDCAMHLSLQGERGEPKLMCTLSSLRLERNGME